MYQGIFDVFTICAKTQKSKVSYMCWLYAQVLKVTIFVSRKDISKFVSKMVKFVTPEKF